MTVSPWPERTYEHLCTLIDITKGALCDSDFDMELHDYIVKTWTLNRGDELTEAAMMVTCLGHRISSDMESHLRSLERSGFPTKETKESTNE